MHGWRGMRRQRRWRRRLLYWGVFLIWCGAMVAFLWLVTKERSPLW